MNRSSVLLWLGVLVVVFFGISCEKNLELELKGKEGQLVLFSFLTPDSAFKVHLSKSVPQFSVDDFERIYDGNITVYKNDRIVDDFIFPFDRSWAVRDSIRIAEGDVFRVEAVSDDQGKVYGETTIPESVPVSIADTSFMAIDQPGDSQREILRCQLSFEDPQGQNNFYQLLVYEQICAPEEGNGVCNRSMIDYPKNDPVFYVREQEESLLGSVDFEGCFSDHLFDGETYELQVDLPLEYASSPSETAQVRKVLFVLVSHTRAYYDYLRSRVVAEYGYELPVVDPIRIYSNVENGLGVVSAYSASKDSLLFD